MLSYLMCYALYINALMVQLLNFQQDHRAALSHGPVGAGLESSRVHPGKSPGTALVLTKTKNVKSRAAESV